MVLRLPYQIKKIADTNPRIPPPVFDHSWFYYLSEVSTSSSSLLFFVLPFQPVLTGPPQCNLLIFTFPFPQYLMIQQTPFVRRQVRKLLLFICGSKEKYRQLRDLHTLDSHVRSIKKLLEEQGIFLRAGVVTATSGSALQYDTLISLVSVLFASVLFAATCMVSQGFHFGDRFILCFVTIMRLNLLQMEHLKACAEIATQRTINWQKFCMKDDCTYCKINLGTAKKKVSSSMTTLLHLVPFFFPPSSPRSCPVFPAAS